jgi:hypothetical protein
MELLDNDDEPRETIFSFTFSNEAGEVTEKQTRKTSV